MQRRSRRCWTLNTLATAGLLAVTVLAILICSSAVVVASVAPASHSSVEEDRPWVIATAALHLFNIAQVSLTIAGYIRVSFGMPRPVQLHVYMLVIILVLPGQSLKAIGMLSLFHRTFEPAWSMNVIVYLNWGTRKTIFYLLVKQKLEVFVSSRACCQKVHRWVNVMIVSTIGTVFAGVCVWTTGIVLRQAGHDSLEELGSVAFRPGEEFSAAQVLWMRLLFIVIWLGTVCFTLMSASLGVVGLYGRGVVTNFANVLTGVLDIGGDVVGLLLLSGISELLFREDPVAGDFNLRIRSLLRSTVLTSRAETVFEGSLLQTPNNMCVVSFPGKFMEDWNDLTWLCEQRELSSACVFLPTTDPGNRFGQHVQCPEDPNKQCWCYQLYGEAQPWGCLWFEIWRGNIEKAVELGLDLIVVFFPGEVGTGLVDWELLPTSDLWDGVGLGGSQKAEVAFLRRQGLEIVELDLDSARKLCLARSLDHIVPPRHH